MIFLASRRMGDFGMKLQAEKFACAILDGGEVASVRCANDAKTFRQRGYFVSVAIPDIELVRPVQRRVPIASNVQHACAILPGPVKTTASRDDAPLALARNRRPTLEP